MSTEEIVGCNRIVKGIICLKVANQVSDYSTYHNLYSFRFLLWGLQLFLLAGCAGVINSATIRLAKSFSSAMLDQNDPQTVREGAPAFLLLVDGFIQDDPDNVQLLLNGAKIYTSYAGAFVEDPERARRLTTRAHDYGTRALCQQRPDLCSILSGPYREFVHGLSLITDADLPALNAWTLALAGMIQAHSDDWSALAELPKVEAAMKRVIEIDEEFAHGRPHLFLGVMATLRPAALGGKPAEGKAYFESAIELSKERDLLAKVLFAKHYARLVFDRELHDRLLKDVLASDPKEPGYTLSNTIAQEEARRLLAGSDEYF